MDGYHAGQAIHTPVGSAQISILPVCLNLITERHWALDGLLDSKCRDEAVAIYRCSDYDGSPGYNLKGWPGNWFRYSITNAETAIYRIEVRARKNWATYGIFRIQIDTNQYTDMTLNGYGWQTLTGTVNISTGLHILRLQMMSGDPIEGVGFFDYITIYKDPVSISNPTYQVNANLTNGTTLANAKTNGLLLQAAFDALPASGGTVQLPAGRFYICQTNALEAYGSAANGTISTPLLTARRTNDLLRTGYDGWVGLRFNVGTSPLDVTHLGRWIVSGNTGSHELQLYKLVGGNLALVASTTLNTATNPAGQFAYVALTPEVRLEANTTCYLFSRESSDYWVNLFDSEIALKSEASGAIGVYSIDPITQGSIYPQGPGHCFGPVNLKFQAHSAGTAHNFAALLRTNNVTIQGTAPGTTLVAFNRVTTIFYIGSGLYHYPSGTDAVTNIVLKDITFEGNPTIDYAGFSNQVGIVSANNLGSICNPLGSLVVLGGYGYQTPVSYSQNLEVRNCVFRNPSSSGLNLLWVRNVLIENCGFSYFEGAGMNRSLANSLKAWCGIIATAPRVENVVVRNNWFNGNPSMQTNDYGSDGLLWLSNGGHWECGHRGSLNEPWIYPPGFGLRQCPLHRFSTIPG